MKTASHSKDSIKTLRNYNTANKPLYLKLLSGISGAIALLGRMSSCDTQSYSQFKFMAQAKKEERFVLNEFGHWERAKA